MKLKEWLKQSTEEMQLKQGYCTLLTKHYATIDAVRKHCVTGERKEIKVHWICELSNNGDKIFRILDGVTGYEEWYLSHISEIGIDNTFCACAGTPGKWDELWLNPEQMKQLIRELLAL